MTPLLLAGSRASLHSGARGRWGRAGAFPLLWGHSSRTSLSAFFWGCACSWGSITGGGRLPRVGHHPRGRSKGLLLAWILHPLSLSGDDGGRPGAPAADADRDDRSDAALLLGAPKKKKKKKNFFSPGFRRRHWLSVPAGPASTTGGGVARGIGQEPPPLLLAASVIP